MSVKSYPKSKFFHLVCSTRELVDIGKLRNYLQKNTINYILSREYGANGHEHLDCFFEILNERRKDHVKRTIISNLNSDNSIPKEELINIKLTINTIDPDPSYGFGYSLKEGNVISSTFTEEQHIEFLAYYKTHSDHVNLQKEILCQKLQKSKSLNLDSLAEMFVEFATSFRVGGLINIPFDDCFNLFHQSVRSELKFTTYSKINLEKLERFSTNLLGATFLTSPSSFLTYKSVAQMIEENTPKNLKN